MRGGATPAANAMRAGAATNDFATASEFAKRFCPKGKPLFSLRKTTARQERTFTSDMALVCDAEGPSGVAGVAALILAANPALRWDEVNEKLDPSAFTMDDNVPAKAK